MQPDSIGPYNIIKEIGRGGMATVYLAEDGRIGREVAIKVLPPQFLHDPDFRSRFQQETRTIASLEHPVIVPLYDFGEEGGQPYMVMRYMSRGSLAERLKQGPLSVSETAAIIERIAAALAVAHQKDIVHRDLKPENILFDEFDHPYLTDFGIAKLIAQTQTITFGIIGTPAYMSPEQWRAKEALDGRTDQYALSVIAYKMLSGELPFNAGETSGFMLAHMSEPIPDILTALPELPPGVGMVLRRGLAKNRDERFQDVTSFAQAFEAAAAGLPVTAETIIDQQSETEFISGVSLEHSPQDKQTGKKWLWGAGMAALLLLFWGGMQLMPANAIGAVPPEQTSPTSEPLVPAEDPTATPTETPTPTSTATAGSTETTSEDSDSPLDGIEFPPITLPTIQIPNFQRDGTSTATVRPTVTTGVIQPTLPPASSTPVPPPPTHTPAPLPTNTAAPPPPTSTPVPPPTATLPPPPTATIAPAPQAQLQGIDQIDKCQWHVRIALTNFAPNSNIGINYNFSEVECEEGGQEASGSRSMQYGEQSDSNGNLLVTLVFAKRYGDYVITFRDQSQNTAGSSFSTSP